MLLTIALVLFGLWILGLVFKFGGKLIHIVLVIALIVIVWHFLSGS